MVEGVELLPHVRLNSACKLNCLPHVYIVLLQLLHEVHNLADL